MENWPDNVVFVHLPRELQKHAELQAVIDAVRRKGDCDVVVDFSDADVVGSPTFSRLLELRSALRKSGHRLILCNVATATRGVFTMAQLDRLFDFAEDESVALATLHGGG
jgi:anti-anti-sigma factor